VGEVPDVRAVEYGEQQQAHAGDEHELNSSVEALMKRCSKNVAKTANAIAQ
jgi:hypothetical protein